MDSCETKKSECPIRFGLKGTDGQYTYHISISVKHRTSDKTTCKVEEDLDRPNPRDVRLSVRLELVLTVPLLINSVSLLSVRKDVVKDK